MTSIRFDGRVAIVTGGASGMGEHYVRALAERGCAVLIEDPRGAPALAEELAGAGAKVAACEVPVGSADNAAAIARAALERFGRIDILINNAGLPAPGAFDRFSEAQVEAGFAVNLLGPFALQRAVWPRMARQGYGRVLNISSNGSLGLGRNAIYAAAKAGMLGLTFDTACEGRPLGILVNAALPSAFTPMTEQMPASDLVDWYRRNLPSRLVAEALVWFVSEACDLSGMAVTTGGGRIARIGFAEGPFRYDPAITPEWVGAHVHEIVAGGDLRLLETQPQASARYRELFPFEPTA